MRSESKIDASKGLLSSSGSPEAGGLVSSVLRCSTQEQLLLLAGLLSAACVGFAWAWFGLLLGPLVDRVFLGPSDDNHAFAQAWLVALVACTCAFISMGCSTAFAELKRDTVRAMYVQAVLRQDVSWFEAKSNLARSIEDDIDVVFVGMGDKASQFCTACSMSLVSYIFAMLRGWQIALVFTLMYPFMAFGGCLMMSALKDNMLETQGWYGPAGKCAREVLSQIRTVVSCGAEEAEYKRFSKLVDSTGWGSLWSSAKVGAGSGFNFAALICTQAAILWVGGKHIAFGTTNWSTGLPWTATDVVCPMCLMQVCIMGIKSVLTVVPDLLSAYGVLNTLFELSQSVGIETDSEGLPLLTVEEIEFENVTFELTSKGESSILYGLNLHIDAGQQVAIVGGPDSGKKAIISLLERFYDVQMGRVLINSVNLNHYSLKDVRRVVGLVQREPVLFKGTIRENMTMGLQGEKMEDLRPLCVQAHMDFVDQLPTGLDTFVGAGGSQFSGSQKQRIAFARTLARKPVVLLLDEATAVLDSETEAGIQKMLAELVRSSTPKVTVLNITHDVLSVQQHDVICVLKSGALVEQGTHSELLAKKGEYRGLLESRQLAERQGRVFREAASQATRSDGATDGKPFTPTKAEVFRTPWRRITAMCGRKLIFAGPAFFAALVCAATEPLRSILVVGSLITLYGPAQDMLFDMTALIPEFLILAMIATISYPFMTLSLGVLQEAVTAKLRKGAYYEMLRVEVGFHDEPAHSARHLSRLLEISAFRVGNIMNSIGMQLEAICCLLFCAFIALSACWPLTLCFVAAVPVLVTSAGLVNRLNGLVVQFRDEGAKETEYALSDSLSDIRLTRSIGAEKTLVELLKSRAGEHDPTWRKRIVLSALTHSLCQGMVLMAFVCCVWVGSKMVDSRRYSFAEVLTVFLCITFSLGGISNALFFVGDSGAATAACKALFEILDRRPQIDGLYDTGMTLEGDSVGCIEFQSVRFSGFSSDGPVLHGINFKAEVGESVAVVGPPAGGKTAILDLLQRFYDPTAGKILVGSSRVPLNEMNVRWWRSKIGYVGREPLLFERSVRENLTYGNPGCPTSHMLMCMTTAGVDFVDTLDVEVGSEVSLTAGQKQRIALCRALVGNPALLLLDDVAATVNEDGKAAVEAALQRARHGRTTFNVLDNVSNVDTFSMILVCSEGVLAECTQAAIKGGMQG